MKMHTFKLFQISNNLVLNSNKTLYDRNLVSKVKFKRILRVG